ncbi:ribonuclease H-like domain-containing protein [Tanacetum coccineum]
MQHGLWGQALLSRSFPMFSITSRNIKGLNRTPKQNEVRQVISENNLNVCTILDSHIDIGKLEVVLHTQAFLRADQTVVLCSFLYAVNYYVHHTFYGFSDINIAMREFKECVQKIEVVDVKRIKKAMFSIGDEKASGPDGFTSLFFKKALDIVGEDVCNEVQDFFRNGKLLYELNYTIISLLPKIITNRIKEGLEDVVSENQSTFVPDRSISDNILITQELMHNYYVNRGFGLHPTLIQFDSSSKRNDAILTLYAMVITSTDFTCELVLLCRDTNKVCLLCEVILKQIPAFDFFCASLESISAIEDTWEREEVWEDIQVVPGFVGRERGLLGKLQKLVSRLTILGVVTPPEDLNVKFLRSLPSEWDTHVVVWMNKPDFDTMGLDDLYNNFKIVEQKVKITAAANNDDKNLAFLTISCLSSTNTINIVNTGVSNGTTKVNTASTETSTASFSDATVYAFLSTQPQGSQLVHEDLEQLHDDDLEEIDLKWNMALLSMRARKFYQRTGRAPRSKDNKNWNQGSSSKAVKIEDASEKAMCAIYGAGFDWSDMAEDEIQANMALMAFIDSEVSIDKSCSKSCLNNYEALKKQYDDLLVKLDDTGFKAATYKRGLSILEAQVVKYKESEVLFSEEIDLLKRSAGHKEYLMGLLKTELEKVKEENEGFEFKIAKFEKSSKDLDDLLASQVTDKSKKGFGYKVVPSPHPLILNRPAPLDLSYSSLEEFKQPEVNEYGPRDSRLKPTTGCDKESDNSKENTDDSLKQQHKTVTETSSIVKEEEPKKARENNDAPIIEDWVSDDEEEVEPIPKVEKKTAIPTATKKESVKPEKPIRRSVRSVNTARSFSTARSVNTVRPSYTVHPKSTVPCARPKTHFQNQAQSTVQRPFYKSTALTKRSNNQNINTGRQTVNTVRPNVNTVRARGFNAVKPSACWVWRPIKPNGASLSNSQLNDKGFVDSGCSRHMSGNIAHLSDFKDFNGGYVTFGGGANGGRITGKGDCSNVSAGLFHKDHPIDQEALQDFILVFFAGFPLQEEQKEFLKPLSDPVWVESNAGELYQFKLQKVMGSYRFTKGHRVSVQKWVYRNKKDERGIVVRNKARLVAQGHTQEEGFERLTILIKFISVKALYGLHQAPRAWYDTLATYLLSNGFQRGQIDQLYSSKVKKGHILLVQIYVDDIIFGSTKKELCDEFEMLMKDNQDKYVHEILRKFNYTDVKSASTPTDLEKPLVKDADADDVDEHLYRSMIGSLMYLTASRPDIMFAVCACARFQVSPITFILSCQRIFRYLSQTSLGLGILRIIWSNCIYDSDYVELYIDREVYHGGSLDLKPIVDYGVHFYDTVNLD